MVVFDVCDKLSKLGLLVAVIVFLLTMPRYTRDESIERAWRVLSHSQGTKGSNGRIEALEKLNRLGVNMQGTNVSRAWLCGIDLSDAMLAGADFSEANISMFAVTDGGGNFAGANLYRSDFSKAALGGSCFKNAVLAESEFTQAGAILTDFSHADLQSSNFSHANLHRADFSNANLVSAVMKNARMCGAKFVNADLRNADLFGTDLGTTDFTNAWIKGTNLARFSTGGAGEPNLAKARDYDKAILNKRWVSRLCLGKAYFDYLHRLYHEGPDHPYHKDIGQSLRELPIPEGTLAFIDRDMTLACPVCDILPAWWEKAN